jgi:hypothetical protein
MKSPDFLNLGFLFSKNGNGNLLYVLIAIGVEL